MYQTSTMDYKFDKHNTIHIIILPLPETPSVRATGAGSSPVVHLADGSPGSTVMRVLIIQMMWSYIIILLYTFKIYMWIAMPPVILLCSFAYFWWEYSRMIGVQVDLVANVHSNIQYDILIYSERRSSFIYIICPAQIKKYIHTFNIKKLSLS